MTTEDARRGADLVGEVEAFADAMASTIEAVLPDVDGRFSILAARGTGSGLVTLRQHERGGIALRVGGQPLLRLVVSYRCLWNTTGRYLAVEKSAFKVFVEGSAVPLLRFDYLRQPAPTVPSAHVNVHAHRDEVVFAKMQAGIKKRGRSRARTVAEGRIPSLRELHIPLGGHRFRPCLEDVLQMLILEFGVDCEKGFQVALDEGRRRYRVQQLRAAAADDLEEVADLLRTVGYQVTPPPSIPSARDDRLTAY